MDQEKRSSWKTLAGLLVAGLFIVGLAVVTSKPFQDHAMQTEVVQETPSASAENEPAPEDEPSKVATEKPVEALDKGSSVAAEADKGDAAQETASEPADEPPSEVAEAEAETSKTGKAAGKEGAAGEAKTADADGKCCKPGDETPPLELVKQIPPGGLHNPYDWKKLKAENGPDYLVKQFRLPGCNECHGGGGGGGFCPALSQGVWFWGNDDDVLFRLIAMGSQALEKSGFTRYQYGTIHAPMPEMGHVIKTSDHLWKIVAFIRSINPPGTNPPEKVIPGKYTPPQKQ